MPVISRTAATATSPFGGGSAWQSFNTSGGSASVSGTCGGGTSFSEHRGCQWSNFGAALSNIIEIRMKYDWNWSADGNGSVDDDGFIDAGGSAAGGDFFGSAGISLTGPGPTSDTDSDGNSGSANVSLPVNTVLSSLATDAYCDCSGSSGTSGSGGGGASVQVSGLVVEVTVTAGLAVLASM